MERSKRTQYEILPTFIQKFLTNSIFYSLRTEFHELNRRFSKADSEADSREIHF